LSGGNRSKVGGGGEGSGIEDSDGALGPSSTSRSNGVGAIVRVHVNVNSSSNDVVDSVQRDLIVDVVVERRTVGSIADDSHVSKMSLEDGWDSVELAKRVKVTSSGESSGAGDISEPMQVESVGSSDSINHSHNSGASSSSSLDKVDHSGDVGSRSGLEFASSDSDSSNGVVGFSGSSVDGRVNDSNDSSSHSRSSISSVGGDTVISQVVEDDSSSNDGVDSRQFEEIESFGLVDDSSNSLPVTHVSSVSGGVSRASVRGIERIPVTSNGESSSVNSGHISPPVNMDSVKGVRIFGDVLDIGVNCDVFSSSSLGENNVTVGSTAINLLQFSSCVDLSRNDADEGEKKNYSL